MERIKKAPLFKLTLLFGGGLALAPHLGGWQVGGLPLGAVLLGLCLARERHWSHRRSEYGALLAIALLMLGLAGLRHQVAQLARSRPDLERYNCQSVTLLTRVAKPVQANPWGGKTTLQAIAVQQDSAWHPVGGRMLAYLPDSLTSSLALHDSVVVKGDLRSVYSRYLGYMQYLHRAGVHHSLRVEGWQIRGRHHSLLSWAAGWQQHFSEQLRAVMPEAAQRGLAQAMFLGDKRHLSAAQKAHFATAGASHVLAISGLHVGIVFAFLALVLRPLRRLPQGKRLSNLVALLLLLAFMVITGASPAVVRAVVMLGAVLLFRICYARYQLLNVVAIAALGQMWVQPSVIHAVGFQLSYAAVLGILLLLPYFERAFAAAQPWLQVVYGWVGVSLTATLATAPLVIAYFGQFPTYFLLTNLLISGFMPLLMGWGFATVLLAGVPYLGLCMGQVCGYLLQGLALLCQSVAKLPHAVIDRFAWDEPALPMLLLQLLLALVLLALPRWWQRWQHSRALASRGPGWTQPQASAPPPAP